MNYLAHAYRFLDQPLFVAGTALPDWMNVLNRRNRPRRQYAQPLLADDDPAVAQLAAEWFNIIETMIGFMPSRSSFA